MSTAEMRRRGGNGRTPVAHRVDFHVLIAVSEGRCRHWVDFASHDCKPGSWVIARPGQVLKFSPSKEWQGWVVMFNPLFLGLQSVAPVLDMLGNHLQLPAADHAICEASTEQMQRDCEAAHANEWAVQLLRHQLSALLLRLQLGHLRQAPRPLVSSSGQARFARFRAAVERDFARLHKVSDYTRQLGCVEKTLSRSTSEMTGLSAKAFIVQRIVLEAQRLLVHTAQPVSDVAALLGMDDASNFVKLFKREVRCTPSEFRSRHGPAGRS
jgi:AraC-like DNA-binding protein